ncbi:MAG: sigma-54 dependent transcriptional regulator [Blastocatellia bacterium]
MTGAPLRTALVVGTDRNLAARVRSYLEKLNFDVDAIREHAHAFDALSQRTYDLASIEMTGGRTCDFELLQYMTRNFIMTATIAVAAADNSRLGLSAMEKGARTIVIDPFSCEEFGQYVRQALESQKHAEEAERLVRRRQQERQDRQIVGLSAAIRSVLDLVSSLADSPYTSVLIKGESGTGKDLVANAIHDATFGDSSPFNAVKCAAIPAELLESELFGHEKGAFTGAYQAKRGIIELTDGGTLFLDEICELPLGLQPKLLRFLDDRAYRRVGGASDLKVSLRVIAATNRNVEKMVESGAFRRDLYFRLGGFPITLPPLRERGADVTEIAYFLVEKISRKYGKKVTGFTETLKQVFLSYQWPGNVRELKNVIERALIISDREVLDVGDVYFEPIAPAAVKVSPVEEIALPLGRPLSEEVAFYEKELIERAIRQSKGVKTSAARLLGISRYSLDRLLKRVDKLTSSDVTA